MWRIMGFMTRLSPKGSSLGLQGLLPLLFVSASFVLLITVSCSKPAGTIGAIINPDESKLQISWTDTTSIYAYSSLDDSVRSDNLSSNILGSIFNPIFGNTTAGFYNQFSLSSFEHSFGDNPQLDSVVVQLLYTGNSYGDTNTQLKIHAYQVEEDMFVDTIYFSNVSIETGDNDFASYSFAPRPNDSVIVEGDTLEAVLRIPLNNSPELGEYLLNAPEVAMENSENFIEYFKGLYFVTGAVDEGGSLVYFDLIPNKSRMTLYYSNAEEDSLRFEYLITSGAARVGKYLHNYDNGSPEFRQQVLEGDTLLGKEKFYIQGLGGVNSTINLPFIKEWRNLGVIAVNEAKLVLTGLEEPEYGAPVQLALFELTEDGGRALLPDIIEGENYFGGYYESSTNSYTFRITIYVQDLISNSDKVNYGLSLYVNNPWLAPQSFIFNGYQPVSDTAVRLKLQMLYTKLN